MRALNAGGTFLARYRTAEPAVLRHPDGLAFRAVETLAFLWNLGGKSLAETMIFVGSLTNYRAALSRGMRKTRIILHLAESKKN